MDDLISRSKAIQWVKAECNPYGQPTLDYESGIKVIEYLERMSSAQPEPVRRGRWLTEYGDHIHAGLQPVFICCSECGMVTAVEWHYCPNCGARMEEGGED